MAGEGEVKILSRLCRPAAHVADGESHVIVGDDADLVGREGPCRNWVAAAGLLLMVAEHACNGWLTCPVVPQSH